jgi:hypothetical protein
MVEHGLVDELVFWVNPTIQGPALGRSTRVSHRSQASWLTKLRLRRYLAAVPASGPLRTDGGERQLDVASE